MKTRLLLLLLFGSCTIFGQDLVITFTCSHATITLDSITATNLRTAESITFTGNEKLTLKAGTGIPLIDELELTCKAYPNPFSRQTSLAVQVPRAEQVTLTVRNQLGQTVAQTQAFVDPGIHQFSLSLNTIGIYTVQVNDKSEAGHFQVVSTGKGDQGNRISYQGSPSLHLLWWNSQDYFPGRA